jgi:hypothetical protein
MTSRQKSMALIATSVFTAIVILLLELASWVVWTEALQGDRYVGLYRERMESVQNLMVDEDTGAIGYERDTTVVTYNTGEFVDRFKVWFSDSLGVGIFDDGIDPGKDIVIAIGDSFGRGVGAGDLSANWVETAERELGDRDILNLSYVGSGLAGYINTYDRLAGHFDHRMVILSFDGDSDFIDSAYSRNRLVLFRSAEDLRKRAIALNYDEGCQRMADRRLKSWTLMTAAEIMRRRYKWAAEGLRDFLPPCPSTAKPPHAIRDEQLKAAREGASFKEKSLQNIEADDPELATLLKERNLEAESGSHNFHGYLIRTRPYFGDDRLASLLTRKLGNALNDFSAKLRADGKCLVIVLHPTKAEVYADRPSETVYGSVTAADLGRPAIMLREQLNADIEVIDPLPKLREAVSAGSEPLYYKVDAHYTPAGYAVVGKAVADSLRDQSTCTDIGIRG